MKPHQWDLIGWDEDVTIRARAVMELSSRALRLYQYFIVKQPDGFPSQKQIAEALTIGEETWSVPTVKRTLAELITKHYIARSRRIKQVSVTQVFKVPTADNKLTGEPIRGITCDPTVGSYMIHTTTSPPMASPPESERPTVSLLYMQNVNPNLGSLQIETLMDGEKTFGYEVMRQAIKEAANSKSADERRFLTVNFVMTIAGRIARGEAKPKHSGGNNHKPAEPPARKPTKIYT